MNIVSRIRNSVPPIGDNSPIICILEDTPSRVEWVERHFPHAHVAWSTTVEDFCASVDAMMLSGRLKLILLDHDLGCNPMDQAMGRVTPSFTEDINGNDGVDACLGMTMYPDVPVFIWSGNIDKSPVMEDVLRDRGFLHVSRCAVDIWPDKVKSFITNVIGS